MLTKIRDFAIVVKLDVTDVQASLNWYVKNLDLVHQPRFDSPPYWMQASLAKNPLIAIGLNLNAKGVGSGGETTTFVVDDYDAAVAALLANGITVDSQPAQGVKLGFFTDPDGNSLGIRQNPPNQPSVASLKQQ